MKHNDNSNGNTQPFTEVKHLKGQLLINKSNTITKRTNIQEMNLTNTKKRNVQSSNRRTLK